jgi:radical SAM/Cys-rich protein
MQRMEFVESLKKCGMYPLRSSGITTMQVNVGCRCNMACKHCHVQAGPSRDEMMGLDTINSVLKILKHSGIGTLDITGGEPALNPCLRYLIQESRTIGCRVMVRTNLTIFCEKGMEDLPDFYRLHEVELIASLPCYLKENVDGIRGAETFDRSVRVLKRLNSLGFGIDPKGRDEHALKLNLVYNPNGAFLPPDQSKLEEDYHRELALRCGVSFNRLYAFANMPLGRFGRFLVETGQIERYTQELKDSFNAATLDGIMCRHIISVGWDGSLYDCDFNQVAGLHLPDRYPRTTADFDLSVLAEREIAFGDHCYACTAGQGST